MEEQVWEETQEDGDGIERGRGLVDPETAVVPLSIIGSAQVVTSKASEVRCGKECESAVGNASVLLRSPAAASRRLIDVTRSLLSHAWIFARFFHFSFLLATENNIHRTGAMFFLCLPLRFLNRPCRLAWHGRPKSTTAR